MKGFNSTNMADDYHTSQSNLMATDAHQEQQQPLAAGAQAVQHSDLYSSGSARQGGGIVDEMQQDLTYLSREAPLDGGESTFGAATSYSQLGLAGAGSQRGDSVLHMGSSQDQLSRHNQEDDLLADWQSRQDGAGSPAGASYNYNEQALNQLSPDNVDIQRPLQQAGQFQEQEQQSAAAAPTESRQPEADAQGCSAFSHLKALKPFLVSFMVDARGGAMRGCRHSGVRVIIPPNSAQMPMRITCRYLRRERLVHPPPLMEGEACASKIMEVGPAGAKFLTPVLIEVPHFASLRGKEREVIILRSDSGEVWREHLFEADQQLVDSIIRSAGSSADGDGADQQFADKENAPSGASGGGGDKKRLTRIVTNEFPQYFAIISRVRQEVHPVGPEGSTVDSQVVDRVQAIFTEGALTKRIKIGLQKHEQQPQATEELGEFDERSGSPAANSQQQHQDRAVSPQSGGSATAKRRSRFLACFGAGHGSIDPLNGDEAQAAGLSTDGDSSAAGGDSPRQPCKEKPVKKRFILGDVNDSDGESAGAGDSPTSLSRTRRHISPLSAAAAAQLVPDDYYIEKEPPLILNVEPTTYGKRMASSSAQTDSKLNGSNGFIMTTSAKKPKKRRRGLLGRRKHKTQMNICCQPAPIVARPKSAEPAPAPTTLDSSLESTINNEGQQKPDLPDSASLIHDVVTSDDLKWRTCTIQTDSDSVVVNYVTLAGADEAAAAAAIAEASAAAAVTSIGDDGYVSGSGDLKKDSSIGKGLFSLSFGSSAGSSATDEAAAAAAKRTTRKKSKERKELPAPAKKETTSDEEEKVSSSADDDEQPARGQLDESLRSVSPTSKELKMKQKLERQEKQKREKEEKRLQKEAEEAAAKAEKLKRKQEKEAKKAEKLAQKSAKKSPSSPSKPASPVPQQQQQENSVGQTRSASQVKFAADLVASSDDAPPLESHEPVKQLDSIQNVIDSTSASYQQQKERLSQADGSDLIEVNISDSNRLSLASNSLEPQPSQPVDGQQQDPSIVSRTLEVHHSIAKTLQDGADELERADEKLISLSSTADEQPSSSSIELAQSEQAQPSLKPILKQQQSTTEEAAAELTISDERTLASKLVSEATEEAVRAADRLKSAELDESADRSGLESPPLSTSSGSKKEEKERLKREAKEEKQRQKEAKRLAKEAEAEAKKAAKEAKLEAERQAKEAKAEQERLAKEAKLEKERLAKEAKLEKERLAKEAKAEKERLAKEAKEAKKVPAAIGHSVAAPAAAIPSTTDEKLEEPQQVALESSQPAEETVQEKLQATDESAADDSTASAKESKKRFRVKLPTFSSSKSKPKKNEQQTVSKSDESEPTSSATDSAADNSAAIAAVAAKVVEEAVAEAERLAKAELTGATDETSKDQEPKAQLESPLKPTVEASFDKSEPTVETETADERGKKKKKPQKTKSGGKFSLSFPKFGSPTKPKLADETTTGKQQTPETTRAERSGSHSSDSDAKLDEALEGLKKATLEAKQEYERLAREAEADELSAEAKEIKLKLVEEAKEKAAEAEQAAAEAKRKFKLADKFKVKLPKFVQAASTSSPESSAAAATADASSRSAEHQTEKEGESLIAEQKAIDVSVESPIESSSIERPEKASSSGKSKKKKKPKKEKKVKQKTSSSTLSSKEDRDLSESEPANAANSSRSSGSFFSRLFSKSKKPASSSNDAKIDPKSSATAEQTADDVAKSQQQQQKEAKPVIVSEMYPSDPDDEDGEMILEVNVPHNLIQETHHHHQQQQRKESLPANDFSQTSDTLATTIDETLATSAAVQQSSSRPSKDLASPTISVEHMKQQQQPQASSLDQDDQATLVNVSQMITSDSVNQDANEDDDDATENIVSQAMDLGQETTFTTASAPKQSLELSPTSDAEAPPVESSSASGAKKSKEELKAEKARKELEAKLEREAKKRAEEEAKEEAKLKKKQAKEEKLKAEAEKKLAKKREKDETERKKREAKESKKLEKAAKKEEKKGKKSKGGVATAEAATLPEPSAVVQEEASGSSAPAVAANEQPSAPALSESSRILSETPINTETEVERIVEEVVGEDGILTKTTKVIETKYVTTRREELRTSEHREIPVDEYERMKLDNLTSSDNKEEAPRRASLSSAASSFDSQHGDQLAAAAAASAPTRTKQQLLVESSPVYEHEELNEIRAIPSYFGPELPEGISGELSPKKAMKKRFKLNKKLIKRALKVAKSESKKAKKCARAAESEIPVCDEAAKQARKKLKRALKEARKAEKVTKKMHKKMDKIDKKLTKREKKIQKRQQKLDKKAAKLAEKQAKRRAKEEAKEAKEAKKLRRSSSGSKKSIKLEDIGDPVLKSSSRLSIGETAATTSQQPQQQRTVMIEREEEPQIVEVSLEDNERQHAAGSDGNELVVHHTITTHTITEHPDGQVSEQTSHRVLAGEEALEAAAKADALAGDDDNQSEEIDVVNDLPHIQAHSQASKRAAVLEGEEQ